MAVIQMVSDALNRLSAINPVIQGILVATLILIIGLVTGKLLGKFVKRLLHEFEADKNLHEATGWKFSVEEGTSVFVTYFTYFIALIMALDTIGITSAVLNMIAGIVVLLLMISAVLAIKDFLPNLVAGISLRSKKEFQEGTTIKIKNVEGKIEEIGLLETRIKAKKEVILIPNSLFNKFETIIKK